MHATGGGVFGSRVFRETVNSNIPASSALHFSRAFVSYSAMDQESAEFDVFKSTKWRGNRKSSYAQIFHARERESHGGTMPTRAGGPEESRPRPSEAPPRRRGGLSSHTLMEFKKAFDRATREELDKVNFIKVCKNIKDVASEMSEKEMEQFFMKVDVTSKGMVDFDDFTSYILQQQLAKEEEPGSDFATYVKVQPTGKKVKPEDSESDQSEGEDEVIAERPPVKSFKACNTTVERPSNIIERIILLSHIQTYVTATQDGMLNLWHADSLKLLRTQKNNSGAWITDIVAMAQQPLAVFAMDRSVTFYDTGRLSFDLLGRIENLRNGALCATWVRTPENDKLLFGDDRGLLHVFEFSDEWGGEIPRVAAGVTEGLLPGMSEKLPWKIHNNWVTKIKYLSHSCSLLSCSTDGHLLMLDLEKQKRKWGVKEHHHGIFALDYCRSFNFIVTCGLERNINIWNPFTAKIMGALVGHQSPVVDVVVNEDDNQIVSVGTDSIIKIWDMRSNRCMQTICDKTLDKTGEIPVFCRLLYDKRRSVLLAGGSSLISYRKRLSSETRSGKICGIGYSPVFRQVIFAEIDTLITIWNVDDGMHTFTFSDSNRSTRVSAMTVDASGRRLLLGGQDGSLRMWNFNNGQCLKEFNGFGQDEVTCMVCLVEGRAKYVAAGGWNGRVCIWQDGLKEAEPLEREMHGHTDDVVAITICPPGGIATGGYDGKVIVWKLDGMVKCVLNPPIRDGGAKPKAIVTMLFLSQLEKLLAVFVADGRIYFWRVPDPTLLHEIATCHIGAPGPLCTDANNEVLFSADSKGYVKAWSLAECDFHQEGGTIKPVPEIFCFRAHRETIITMAFVDSDRILITASILGTSRLWSEKGVKIGQFGHFGGWDLSNPDVWAGDQPSYVLHESSEGTPSSSRASTSTGSRSSSSMESRGTLKQQLPSTLPEEKPPPEVKPSPTQMKAQSILDAGPPHLRLDSWFTPLQAAFQRQLPIKKIVAWGPLIPTNLHYVRSKPVEEVSEKSETSGRKMRKSKHYSDPMRLSLPNIQFNMPKDKLASLMRKGPPKTSSRSTTITTTTTTASTKKKR